MSSWSLSFLTLPGMTATGKGCLIFSLPRCPLFVILQRWNFHQGMFCVGAMHRLAVVAQGSCAKRSG